jgi:very-short-patch-repair endonuclease
MDTLGLVKNRGGVARTGMLLDTGVTKRQIAAHVRRGELLRLRPGVLALPDAPHDFLTAIRNDGFLTCVSAASHYGLWLHTPSSLLHLSCLHARSKDVVNHRSRSVPAHPYLPLVGLVDVLVHALHCLPEDQAAVIVESALRRGDTVRSFLLERLEGPRNGKARAALDRVTGCAESPIEVVARLLFRDAGIRLQTQVPIKGVGRVDFLLEGILIVEVDGDAYHSSRKERTRDRRRDNAALEQGYLSLHFGYEDVMFNQEKVLSQVMAVLARTRRR